MRRQVWLSCCKDLHVVFRGFRVASSLNMVLEGLGLRVATWSLNPKP